MTTWTTIVDSIEGPDGVAWRLRLGSDGTRAPWERTPGGGYSLLNWIPDNRVYVVEAPTANEARRCIEAQKRMAA